MGAAEPRLLPARPRAPARGTERAAKRAANAPLAPRRRLTSRHRRLLVRPLAGGRVTAGFGEYFWGGECRRLCEVPLANL
jgi:hypothetical protein